MRELAKKLARQGLAKTARWRNVGAAPRVGRVLTYHKLVANQQESVATSVGIEMFARQLHWLKNSEEVEVVPSPQRLIRNRGSGLLNIWLTFDDGHVSTMELAIPVLQEYEFGAAFFIPTDHIGKVGQLNATQIRHLAELGFVVGSHGASHRSMGQLSPHERRAEMLLSKRILEDITGQEVTTFAYPFGTQRDFSHATRQDLHESGYSYAYTSQHGPIERKTDLLCCPRVKIEGSDALPIFGALVLGAMDAWRWVDQNLWWLQRGKARKAMATGTFAPEIEHNV